MRRVMLGILLTLALPVTALGKSVEFTNTGGTLTGTNSGFALTGSTLTSVNGFGGGGVITGNLGTLALTTGALTSGLLTMGGTFASGGSFTITGNGSNGLPNGTIFSGSFSGPVTWTLVTLNNGTHDYTLTGALTGLYLGVPTNGVTVQLTVNTGTGFFNGSAAIASGDSDIVIPARNGVVAEPGTLGLLSTGLLGVAGLARRRARATYSLER
ncbi:MAG TPA: PEP-CTERM sorting domain-containing protein [Terriglobales bacterium]|nr:PEP-CTERM sorting domain-containing protein [Terriglobales bacterium]